MSAVLCQSTNSTTKCNYSMWKPSICNKLPPRRQVPIVVHLKYGDGGAAAGGKPHDSRASEGKMISPAVVARVVKRHNSSRMRVHTGYVGTLEAVASHTAQGEVPQQRLPSMLTSDYVVDRKARGGNRLWQTQ